MQRGKNVAIANALQLEAAARATPAFSRLLRRHAKFEVAEPIHCRIIAFLLLIHYLTLWPWPLTLWPWPWTFAACRLWWNFVPNLNAIIAVTCCTRLWNNFHKVWPSTTYPRLNYSVLMLIRYVTLWPWPLTSWPRTYSTSGVMRLNSVQKLSEIEWFTAELLTIYSTFSPCGFSGMREPNFTELGEDTGRSFLHEKFVWASWYLATFSNACGSKLGDVENDAKFCTFWPPVSPLPLCEK